MAHYTADAVLAAGHTLHPAQVRRAVIVLDTGDTAEDYDESGLLPDPVEGPAVVLYERARNGGVGVYPVARRTAETLPTGWGGGAGMLIDGPSPYSQLVAETLAVWYR